MTDDQRKKFLEAIELGVSVKRACRRAGLARSSAYLARNTDPDFAAAWAEAEVAGVVAAAKEIRTTTNPVRLKAAFWFLQSHDGNRWRTRKTVKLTGGISLGGEGLAALLAKAREAPSTDAQG